MNSPGVPLPGSCASGAGALEAGQSFGYAHFAVPGVAMNQGLNSASVHGPPPPIPGGQPPPIMARHNSEKKGNSVLSPSY